MIDRTASVLFELRQHAFFEDLAEDDLRDLTGASQTKTYKARQTLFQQGDEGDTLYVVLSGRIKISTNSVGGKETVLCFMGPGDVLGEIAVLDGDTRTATASVIEEARMLVVHQTEFFRFLEAHPKIALTIIRVLCGRLRKTDTIVEEMTTLQAGPRLARAILRLADQYGKEDGVGTLLDIKLSQSNLGAHAGLMRENVNRQLKMWEDEGVLQNNAGSIRVLQMETLEDIAEGVA